MARATLKNRQSALPFCHSILEKKRNLKAFCTHRKQQAGLTASCEDTQQFPPTESPSPAATSGAKKLDLGIRVWVEVQVMLEFLLIMEPREIIGHLETLGYSHLPTAEQKTLQCFVIFFLF